MRSNACLTGSAILLLAACNARTEPATAAAPDMPPLPPPALAAATPSPCPAVPTHDAAGNPLPQPQWTADSPVGVTAEFFEKVLVGNAGSGAPDADTLEAWRPYLTRALVAALDRARAVRDAASTANPDDKPPYVEGALFVSLFEGYTRAQPITVAMEGDNASVPVCFAYDRDGQKTEWTDTVKLVREGGTWRIDDVRYGGQWDFANAGTLREALPRE